MQYCLQLSIEIQLAGKEFLTPELFEDLLKKPEAQIVLCYFNSQPNHYIVGYSKCFPACSM